MTRWREPELIDEQMSSKSQENLKVIYFEEQMLPQWAQLLFLAARLCPVPPEVGLWFSRFTSYAGVESARTVMKNCRLLRTALGEHRESVLAELQHSRDHDQPEQILAAWKYSLDTIIQEARGRKTCSWTISGAEGAPLHAQADEEVKLKRVKRF